MFSNRDSLRRVLNSGNHQFVKVKPRLLHWDHHNMQCLPKKTTGPGELPQEKGHVCCK